MYIYIDLDINIDIDYDVYIYIDSLYPSGQPQESTGRSRFSLSQHTTPTCLRPDWR